MRRSAAKFASLIKEAAPITKLISEFLALRVLENRKGKQKGQTPNLIKLSVFSSPREHPLFDNVR